MYMISSVLFIALIVVLEIGPAYLLLMRGINGRPVTSLQWLFIVGSFFAVLIVAFLVTVKPIQMGIRSLEKME